MNTVWLKNMQHKISGTNRQHKNRRNLMQFFETNTSVDIPLFMQ